MIAELPRLNELARKARTATLSADELNKREQLRRRYLQQISGQMKNILSTVTVIDSEGRDVTPAKLRDAQARGMTV